MLRKIDYWFLNLASSHPAYLRMIMPDDHPSMSKKCINLRTPRINTKEVIDSLNRLFQEGLLLAIKHSLYEALYAASWSEPSLDELIPLGFIPSADEIQREFIYEEPSPPEEEALSIFLTHQGGKLWELIFQPEWNKYFARGGDGVVHKLYCVNPDIGRKLIEMSHLLSYDDESSCHLISGTEMWEEITPWRVNNWKILPVGYCVSYQTERIVVNKSQELIQERKKAHDFLMDVWRWYNKDYYGDLIV
jgi:hypothetical protein